MQTGARRIELDEAVLTVTPPFGLSHEGEYDVVRTGPLLEALDAAPRVAVLLVRMGGYAVGVFEGERLVASKVGTRFVKGRHKKGGSSSNRFRRRRGEQERELSTRPPRRRRACCGPWRDRVEHVALGGDRSAVTRVLESRADLAWLQPLALERFFDVARAALARARGAAVPALRARRSSRSRSRTPSARSWHRRPSRSHGGRRAGARRARRGPRRAPRPCPARG